MLVFPNCKINLGLNIVHKRPDGFHDIETVFYPVNWCDALEIIESHDKTAPFVFSASGLTIHAKAEDNLLYKAWKLISGIKGIPPIKAHLHKTLPMGAGLGGGSADAAFLINLLDSKFNLSLSLKEKEALASELGSDCSFFIKNQPVLAKGRGDTFSDLNLDLSNYYILIVFPGINCNTKEAYSAVNPKPAANDLKNTIENIPVSEWKHYLTNDFEEPMFIKYPAIHQLKQSFYASGALYASMSGSGSSVYGIFDKKPAISFDATYSYYLQTPASKIL